MVAMPFQDTVNNESYVMIRAIRDIAKNEQLLLSYGRLSNSHLIQKYGFTTNNNPYNQVSISAPYHDFQSVVSEEAKLKAQARERLGFA